MDESFCLVLPVTQVNKPADVPDQDSQSVRVTLRHTLAHIRQSIWMFSHETQLKPMFQSFRFRSSPVSDSLPLAEIFSVEKSADLKYDHGLSLIFDYTLFNSPAIPHRDPVPDFFDVKVMLELLSGADSKSQRNSFSRETLVSSVLSIKELAASKFGLKLRDTDLIYDGCKLEDTSNLRDVLHLDVPPLASVEFELHRRPVSYPVSVHTKSSHETVSPFTLFVEQDVLVRDFKAKIATETGLDPARLDLYVRQHCFSKASSQDSSTRLSEIIPLKEDPEMLPQISYVVVPFVEAQDQKLGSADVETKEAQSSAKKSKKEHSSSPEWQPRLQQQIRNYPSETYEIEYNGNVVELTTAECILDPSGRLLLNAHAMAKLSSLGANTTAHSSQISENSAQNSGNSTNVASNQSGLEGQTASWGAPQTTFPTTESHDLTNHENSVPNASAPRYEDVPSANNQTPRHTSTIPLPTRTTRTDPEESLNIRRNVEIHEIPDISNERVERQPVGEATRHIERPVLEFEENLPPRHEPLREPRRANGNVLRTLVGVFNQHRAFLFQQVLQIGLTLFFMGGDLFFQLFEPTILTVLAGTSATIAVFMFGIEISDWIDEQVLAHGNENSLDYALLRCVSLTFRSATSLNERICRAVSRQCVRLAACLHQTRLERLEASILGNSYISSVKNLFLQVTQALFMWLATGFPFLQFDLSQYFEETRRREEQELRKSVSKSLQKLRASGGSSTRISKVQAELRTPIDILADVDAKPGSSFTPTNVNEDHERGMEVARIREYEDLIRCYLSLKWFERHTSASQLPASLLRH